MRKKISQERDDKTIKSDSRNNINKKEDATSLNVMTFSY